MPAQIFAYWCLESHHASGLLRLDALGFPEIGAVHARSKRAHTLLERRLQALKDEHDIVWSRRAAPQDVQLEHLELQLMPATGKTDWQQPVQLHIAYARWTESPQRHLAWVPAADLMVLCEQPEPLTERLLAELQLWLGQRRQRPGLAELARQWAATEYRLSARSCTVQLESPRERLQRSGKADVAENPVLQAVASRLDAAKLPAARVSESDLRRLAEALVGPGAHSVLLVGPEGCGKSTLFQQLVHQGSQYGLTGFGCWSTSGARLIAGQSGFGMWQQRCRDLCRELAASPQLLHLGPLRELLEVGRTRAGEQSIAGFLRGDISRGGIRVIAECTPDEMQAIERAEPALIGAFQIVEIEAPSSALQRELLEFEWTQAAGPTLPISTVQPALNLLDRLHRRYAGYSARPARALRFLRERLAEAFPDKLLLPARIFDSFSRQTGLPRLLLDDEQTLDPAALEQWFAARVLGQAAATTTVVDRLLRIKTGLVRPGRPLASLLLVGPTGTGKTELARTLAEYLFGSAERLTRFDLSEVTDAAALARLVGGPGAGAAEGLLTARIREQPFSVLLFDEFEKADPGFFDLLLQMLGEARLTDGAGRLADFSNAVIVLTSNLGAAEFQRGRTGFVAAETRSQSHFEQAVQRFLRPELYNRFDAIVPFSPLGRAEIEAVARRQLQQLASRPGIAYGGFELALDPALPGWLAERGHDARYGARPLKRLIEQQLVVPLAEALNTPAELPLREVQVSLDQAAKIRIVQQRNSVKLPGTQSSRQWQAEYLQQRRRELDALAQCALVQGLRDEQALLRQRLLRKPRKGVPAPPPQPLLEARLRLLDQVLRAVEELLEATTRLEDQALLALWAGAEHSPASVPAELLEQARQIRRKLFRVSFDKPDRLWLSVYSEHPEWLRRLLTAYLPLASTVKSAWVIPRLRGSETKPKAQPVLQPDKLLQQLPADLLGVQLELHGDLIAPLLSAEAGLHRWKPAKADGAERVALVAADPLQPIPPGCVAINGGIQSSGLTLRRAFDAQRLQVMDARSDPERQPWNGEGQIELIRALLQSALESTISRLHEDP